MDNARRLLVDLPDHNHAYSQAMIHEPLPSNLLPIFSFPVSSSCSKIVPFCGKLFNIQPSTMVTMTSRAVLLRVLIIRAFVPLVRPMNRIDPPHSPKTPIKKLVMPVMESNPPTHKRNKCIPRVHCRRFNQLKRQK